MRACPARRNGPMKDFYVRDAAQFENKVITTSFVVASKQVKSKKSGEPYLALTLADRSGHLEAKVWDNVSEIMESFGQDDFVKVKGLLNKFNNRFQLTVHKLRRMAESEVDFGDYLPKCPRDVDALWRTLGDFVASFQNPHLKALVLAFMDDPDIAAAYRTAPAAKSLHHAYIGGLLDHVVSLCRLCDLACRNYPLIDRDLLLTGAFLHDIGKVRELIVRKSISYTTEGRLLGHISLGYEMVAEKINAIPGFSQELSMLLKHIMLSHHGEYEFGSPKRPKIQEAVIINYLDDLSAKINNFQATLKRENVGAGEWTAFSKMHDRYLYRQKDYTEPGGTSEEAEEKRSSSSKSGRLRSGAGPGSSGKLPLDI